MQLKNWLMASQFGQRESSKKGSLLIESLGHIKDDMPNIDAFVAAIYRKGKLSYQQAIQLLKKTMNFTLFLPKKI